MSYIIKRTNPIVNTKLTEKGRQKLAQGKLNFSYWAVGDSEVNYKISDNDIDLTNNLPLSNFYSNVLKPKDQQGCLKYYLKKSDDSYLFPFGDGTSNSDGYYSTVKLTLNNKANQRGFYTGGTSSWTANTGTDYFKTGGTVSISGVTGQTVIDLGGSGFTDGDYVMFAFTNDTHSATTQNILSASTPTLFYKIQSSTGTSVTLDRNLPDLLSSGSGDSRYTVYPGGESISAYYGSGNTTSYWNTSTLTFESDCDISTRDVKVWNLNNVWEEDMVGITGSVETYINYGSTGYTGTKYPYLGYPLSGDSSIIDNRCAALTGCKLDDGSKGIGIIHYTNNNISNFYGEYLYLDSTKTKNVVLDMPHIMWHRRKPSVGGTGSGTTIGMRFNSTHTTGTTKTIDGSCITYIDLIEDTSMTISKTATTVGRVYPELKVITIHDEELLATMSYKSNRNWTLPKLNAQLTAPIGGSGTGSIQPNETMYLTYMLTNPSGTTNSSPCQYYVKLENNTSLDKDIKFNIDSLDLLPYMRKKEDASYDGLGFYAHNFKLLAQKVSSSTIRPSSELWREKNFSGTSITTNSGTSIDPLKLERQNPDSNEFILSGGTNYSGLTIFNLSNHMTVPGSAESSQLQYGDERFFYGNIDAYIGATTYKSLFTLNVSDSTIKKSSNPSWTTNTDQLLKVTEVGVYDRDKDLVMISKLSSPIELIKSNTISIEVSIDF